MEPSRVPEATTAGLTETVTTKPARSVIQPQAHGISAYVLTDHSRASTCRPNGDPERKPGDHSAIKTPPLAGVFFCRYDITLFLALCHIGTLRPHLADRFRRTPNSLEHKAPCGFAPFYDTPPRYPGAPDSSVPALDLTVTSFLDGFHSAECELCSEYFI